MATHGSLRWSAVRFDLFPVDLSSGELFRSGVRVPIQDQPLQLLRLLLEAEGRVVTREQLRVALWAQDTFVDFEHAFNTAVKKLRQALQDSAEHPKFVETLPRVGYRFITTVEWVSNVRDNNPLPRIVAIAPPGPVAVTQKLPPRKETLSGDIEQADTLLPHDAVAPETQRKPSHSPPGAALLNRAGWHTAASRPGVQGSYPNSGCAQGRAFHAADK